jgi:hypothetical protein
LERRLLIKFGTRSVQHQGFVWSDEASTKR